MNKTIGGILTNVEEKDLELLKSNPKEFWDGVDVIGNYVFSNNTGLKKVILENGIKRIEEGAFELVS